MPLAKTTSQPRNPTEPLSNAPAHKSGWLYKRGLFEDLFKFQFNANRLLNTSVSHRDFHTKDCM